MGKRKIDSVIASNSKLPKDVLDKYLNEEMKKLVKIDKKEIEKYDCELIERDILKIEDGLSRHDSLKLATEIFYYLMRD